MKINNKNISTEIEKPKEKRTNMHFNHTTDKSSTQTQNTTIGDKSLDHHQHAPHQEEEHMMALQVHDGRLFLNKW
jgi:hypothetical protein